MGAEEGMSGRTNDWVAVLINRQGRALERIIKDIRHINVDYRPTDARKSMLPSLLPGVDYV